ncbi:MAG: T9SS type A sorting domain-containing protein [Chitinophagales bacterium]|nr:T9SS type A sorting domain-containing protein [Chitinophagales bacterium]
MKKSLLVIAGLTFSMALQAQITLNSSNAPSTAQCQSNDTFRKLSTTGLPDLSPKTNATWDLTGIADLGSFFTYNGVASSGAFPNATFTLSRKYLFSALSYNNISMFGITGSGIIDYGEHIDRQPLSIGALTGDPGDSLVFAQQDIIYSPSETVIKYPCTMSTTWTDVNSFNTKFNLTVSAYSLNNTPGERRTVRTEKKTVKGWGKMKVDDENGNPTGYMDVLLVELERSVKDSFYLGGSPAPAPLLTAFGVSQGQVLDEYFRFFYRAGEFKPLLELEYTNSSFTTVSSAEVHSERLAPTSVNTISKEQINIYPNPVANGSFTVKVDGAYKSISYQLYNMTGQVVAANILPANGTVSLPADVPAGNYFIKLQTEGGAYGVKQVNIVK